jgi:hypothetical protein
VNLRPLRTTVVGSYPFPGWLEFAMANASAFGPDDRREMIEDAVAVAVHDQVWAGLDVITSISRFTPFWKGSSGRKRLRAASVRRPTISGDAIGSWES